MKKLISNQISPNLNLNDFLEGFLSFLCVKRNLNFEDFFQTKNFFLCNAARTGLAQIIKILEVPDSKKTVGIPAFCCGVMATPFLAQNFKIQWIDTDAKGNMDFEDFKKKSKNISILLLPHIFGQKKDLASLFNFCKTHSIFLIEDEAHSFVPTEKKENNFFNAKILSFGREKTFSCVSGGAVIWEKNSSYHAKFLKSSKSLPKAKISWTLKHLFQIFIFSMALPFWYQGGKIIPWLSQKLKILPLAVTAKEKNGIEDFPQTQLPFALQKILYRQFLKVSKIQEHRKKIALEWKKILTQKFPNYEIIVPKNYFRVILKCPNEVKRNEIFLKSKKQGFLLNEWDGNPISPKTINLEKFQYSPNDCPTAENFSKIYLTFPTNSRVRIKEVQKFL